VITSIQFGESMKTGYVYIVECSDQSFYTGVTNNVERRLCEHNTSKQTSYILNRKPIKLVWVSDELEIQDAISLEKQIKGWRREKKIALINERFDDLPDLSVAYFRKK
jgi:putative endonuclease